ncbi:MAG: MgtC/SapB family protein [Clostridium sulfidigenes]|uniref:MgtC/SapB family protein n=1 Tax=Clostridium sulfidigenes TaxID=318464 RepID=A0A927WDN9_9CLOT|nr:MgtC/SapB family protein [Clostridium sulfidigenes]
MDYIVVLERLIVGVIVGGLVGYEREFKNSPAGFRTHILVCLGATIISLIAEYDLQKIMIIAQNPMYAEVLKVDTARLGAQVISGVGFLGAGTILRDKGSVRGLTTAATLWTVACLGLAVGRGLYALSITAALIIFIILSLFKKADKVIQKDTKWRIGFRKKEKEDEVDEDYNITEGKNSEDVITLYEKLNEPISRE